MARCDCGGGQCGCVLIPGDNVTISGTGSAANGYKISAEVPCTTVRGCLSAGDGVTFDQGTGVISSHVSDQAGNNVLINPDGGLYVPTAGGAVLTGCGLTGDGTASAPIRVNSEAADWPYPCAPGDAGTPVVCGPDGKLLGAPGVAVAFSQVSETRTYDDVPISEDAAQIVDTISLPITNPSSCFDSLIWVEQEFDMWVVLPRGANYAAGFDGDETIVYRNNGSDQITGMHVQFSKALSRGVLAPSASSTVQFSATAGLATNGAYFYRIGFTLRCMLIAAPTVIA